MQKKQLTHYIIACVLGLLLLCAPLSAAQQQSVQVGWSNPTDQPYVQQSTVRTHGPHQAYHTIPQALHPMAYMPTIAFNNYTPNSLPNATPFSYGAPTPNTVYTPSPFPLFPYNVVSPASAAYGNNVSPVTINELSLPPLLTIANNTKAPVASSTNSQAALPSPTCPSTTLLPSSKKQFQCAICNKVLGSKVSLKNHQDLHEGKKYTCGQCGKSFAQKAGLHNHRSFHEKEKPYKCPACQKRFADEADMVAHLAGHKKHQCGYCGKQFWRSMHLQEHIRHHTGEKPYQCTYCKKDFVSKSNLKVHTRLHTGEKPYECKTCAKKYASKGALSSHCKRKHKKESSVRR